MRWLLMLLLIAAPTAAMAMPPLLAAVGYALAAYAGYITVAQAVIMIAVTVYGAVSSREAARRARNQARDAYNAALQDRTVTLMSTEAPWQIVYGEAVVGGTVVTILTSGDKDQYKHMVVVWAAHECEAILDVFINGVSVGALDSNGYVTGGNRYFEGGTDTVTVTGTVAGDGTIYTGYTTASRAVSVVWTESFRLFLDGNKISIDGTSVRIAAPYVSGWIGKNVTVTLDTSQGTPRLRVRHHLGTLTQEADSATMAECPSDWGSSDRGLGLCYSIFRLDLNEAEFQGGPPQVTARVRGRKLYDRRTGTTAWTDNNALCTDDFLQAEWGKRALASQIVDSSVQACANVCDEALSMHDGAKRYTCNGSFTTDRNPDTTLTELCQSMAGFVTYTGAWHLQAGAWTAPVMDLGDAENAGAIEGITEDSASDAFNGVRGQFYDPARFDQLTDYVPYQNDSYVTEDGGELWSPLNFPFTNSQWRVTNLARIHTERSRGMTLVVPMKRIALKLRVGQRVRYSNSVLGLNLQTFRVVKRPYRLGQPVQVTLAQDLESFYDEVDDPPTALSSPSTHRPNPWVVAAVEGLAAESGTATLVLQTDGTVLSRVRVHCTASADVLVQKGGALQIEYRRQQDAGWQRAPEASGEADEAWLLGLEELQVYIVRARWRNSLGAVSEWRSVPVLHLGKSAPPADVTGLAAQVLPGAVAISRVPSSEADYAYTIYRHGPLWASAYPIPGRVDRSGITWSNPDPGTYTIWAADVDDSGNIGSPVSFGPVTVLASDLGGVGLGIKLNALHLSGDVSHSNAYMHAVDSSNNAIDEPGAILVNGVRTPVPNERLTFSMGSVTGYLMWQSGAPLFLMAGDIIRYFVIARLNQGQWQYDNLSGWVDFAPTPSMLVIGTVQTGNVSTGPGIVTASLFAAAQSATSLVSGPQGPQGIQGPAGSNGLTTYFHVAYANSADGSVGFNQTSGAYIGTYVDTTAADSSNPASYTWRQFVGSQGAQGNQGIPGTNGANGQTSYLHIKYSNDGGVTFTGSGGEDVGAFIGTYVDFNSGDSASVGSYSWARIKGDQGPQGPQGPQGIQGPAGSNGLTTYFHVAYANSADGTVGFNQTSGAYIGTYVDTTAADSSNPASYTWRQFVGSQGAQGNQGIPGTNGANGQTSYLHIKYSNDGGASFTGNGGEDAGAYIGTYVDFNSGDSASVGSYSWARIKGDQGPQGPQGPQGIQGPAGSNGLTTYFHVAYANSADGSVGFNQTSGAYIGTYVDTTAADSSNPASYTWRQFVGSQGAQGNQGIPGTNGANGQTSYLHIKYSNDGGVTFTGSGGEDVGAFIGTYVDFTAADSTSPGAYQWARLQAPDYQQEGAPSGAPEGSTWRVPSTGRTYKLIGGTWQPYVGSGSVGTGELASDAATVVVVFADAVGVGYSNYA